MTRPFLTAEWRSLVMLNFRVNPEVLTPLVPHGTVLDAWQGQTWVSLVGFQFVNTRLFGLPVPGHRDFPEINLRFYVREPRTGRRAVVFLKEIVPRRAIAWVARAAYNEPYVVRPMRADSPRTAVETPGRVEYSWRHGGRWNRIGASAAGPAVPIVPASEAEFITEHYWGYTRQRDGGTIEYGVEHPRWAMWPVTSAVWDVDVAAEYGSLWAPILTEPSSVFLADGSAVAVGRPQLLLA